MEGNGTLMTLRGSRKDYEDAALFREFVRVVNVDSGRRSEGEFVVHEAPVVYVPCEQGHEEQVGPCEYQRERLGRRATVTCVFPEAENEARSRMPRQRLHSFDLGAGIPRASRQEVPSDQGRGFVCVYCDARYVYRRCLVNHLVKNHRKCIK